MVMLSFLLDLPRLSPTLVRDIKQGLLQLANYYAVSRQTLGDEAISESKPLSDRIGLCYVYRNRVTCSDELKIAYNPHGSFNLRDFHHAVNNLPIDTFSPEINGVGSFLKLADILGDQVIYTLGVHDESVQRKVILVSSCLADAMDSMTMKALKDAAERSVSFEFILFEDNATHFPDISENMNQFVKQIGSAKNCSYKICHPDLWVLFGLSKRWFQELKDDYAETLQAHFLFNINLISTLNKISCNLSPSINAIGDEFIYCETCRCHGIPLNHSDYQTKRSSCPVTDGDLEALDIIENSVKVGQQTILYMPSFQCSTKLHKVSSPIEFNVIQRTSLRSLDEGFITGATYFVVPTFHNSDENNQSELNSQLFQAVCRTLNSLDQGLICYSYCNIETAKQTSFRCYYILLPSDKGLMLIRMLSASEEFLPIPDISQYNKPMVGAGTENIVKASLLKMELNDYKPTQHERGFHQKLNLLVKESLQFGAIQPKSKEGYSESDLITKSHSLEILPSSAAATDSVTNTWDQIPKFDIEQGENITSPCIAEEWEQLIVTELETINSPSCMSSTKLDQVVTFTSPSQGNNNNNIRQVDEKTSRILERLEIPKQLKRKVVSPTIQRSAAANTCAPVKKPLIPFGPNHSADKGMTSSQSLKPNFQKIRRER